MIMTRSPTKILVIRLGALGDLVLITAALAALKAKWPNAQLAVLTQPNFANFVGTMPWVDQVLTDPRDPLLSVSSWQLVKRVRDFSPDLVIDLQGKLRQNCLYFALGGPLSGCQWSGPAWGASHPRPWPPVAGEHYLGFVARQLATLQVPMLPAPNLDWLSGSLPAALPTPYAVLLPGSAPTRPEKRWPIGHYVALAAQLQAAGLTVVALGGASEAAEGTALAQQGVLNWVGQTSLGSLASVLRGAALVVANDTGPGHIAAAVGAPTLTLFSSGVDPAWSRPLGTQTSWLQTLHLADLAADQVWAALSPWLAAISAR